MESVEGEAAEIGGKIGALLGELAKAEADVRVAPFASGSRREF
jgi:hypothetical protein